MFEWLKKRLAPSPAPTRHPIRLEIWVTDQNQIGIDYSWTTDGSTDQNILAASRLSALLVTLQTGRLRDILLAGVIRSASAASPAGGLIVAEVINQCRQGLEEHHQQLLAEVAVAHRQAARDAADDLATAEPPLVSAYSCSAAKVEN